MRSLRARGGPTITMASGDGSGRSTLHKSTPRVFRHSDVYGVYSDTSGVGPPDPPLTLFGGLAERTDGITWGTMATKRPRSLSRL